jgi:hypothetical protein
VDVEMPLIKDAINRVIRTLLQQLAVVIQEALLYLVAQPDLTDIEPWQVALAIAVHAALSMTTAFLHRTVVDPSKIPSVPPPNTPTFRERPLEPPAPFQP